ncbi:MAG: 16S rRNA (cytosine(1402)-N(4))-methyltransferase RsmH [Verrucomicrobiales bacterium]|nr:16S rRNA (cytosine(1402)-N(4))-methyltransferase RsmH [Verrucomicrobiales bacterium]
MRKLLKRFLSSNILNPADSAGINGLYHLSQWPAGCAPEPKLSAHRNEASPSGVPSDKTPRFKRSRQGGDDYHHPVLLEEVTHYLAPKRDNLYLDATLGGGGHSEQLLRVGAKVIGMDQDPAALSFARARLGDYRESFGAIQGNFREFGEILETIGISGLDGVLLDLGISSRQVDDADRGFSFSKPGPLDMRMDPDVEVTAAELVNSCDEEELARVFYHYGEERASRKIARGIVERRREKHFHCTTDLAQFVESMVPRRGRIHPATRVFQALRIAVNNELRALEEALAEVPKWLRPGGRLVVISFHSLEDRIVKSYLKRCSKAQLDRPEWPAPKENPEHYFKLLVQKGLTPSPEEIKSNPRARSARLRVAERLEKAVSKP